MEVALNNIIETYNKLLLDCTRKFTKTVRLKGEHCPWMTYSLWRLIQIKNNYLNKQKSNPTDEHITEMLEHVSKKVKSAKKRCKKQYYENILKSSSHSNVWKKLNEIFGRTKANEKLKLRNGANILESDQDVAEMFNCFFSSIGNNLAQKIPKNAFDFLKPVKGVGSSIFLRPASINVLDI